MKLLEPEAPIRTTRRSAGRILTPEAAPPETVPAARAQTATATGALRSLRLKNLALADDLRWELGPGLNVLTGETGAGKSILIDGLNLLLGVRADKSLIRSGETQCTAEAEIALSSPKLRQALDAVLEDIGAEPCEGETLLLKRVLSANGANRQYANGSAVTLAGLRRLGELLVDVHGPHDHQSLLHVDQQTAILDAYGKHDAEMAAYRACDTRLRELRAQAEALNLDDRQRAQRLELLEHQVDEIDTAALISGEDETIERDYRLARGGREIIELAGTIDGLLNENEASVLQQLAQIDRALGNWHKIDPAMSEVAALNQTAVTHLTELLAEVQDAADRVDADPARLAALEERINLIQRLKSKYGDTIEEILAHGEDARAELEKLQSSDAERERLAAEQARAERERAQAAEVLTRARRKTAAPLAKTVQHALRSLGFAKALFEIRVTDLTQPARNGADLIEFIFAPNPGEEPRPLRAIASSGEMARVMLAIKTTLAQVDAIPILVFDEVDANVGGETATAVGASLRALGGSHQVLCITHLPQVAAHGQRHFAVSKLTRQKRTVTELTRLDGDDRHREIARMLGGQSKDSLALAQTLLEEASG